MQFLQNVTWWLKGLITLVVSNNLLVNVNLAATAINVGSALQYSVQCQVPRNPNSDEYKFSRAMFLLSRVGGSLILAIQLVLVWIGLSYLPGWASIVEIGRLI